MRTPSWEPSAGALLAWLLANVQARPLDLWTITLQSGTVLRYAAGDVARTVNGTTWSIGPGVARGTISRAIGIEVDTMRMRLQADPSVLVGGVPLMQALARGVFSGATVLLERAFFDDTGTCRGVVEEFYGRVGGVRPGRLEADLEVRSHVELLDVMIPAEIYQPSCRNTVFDAQCGLSGAAWTVACATDQPGEATRRIVTTATSGMAAKAAGWADLGLITFTSGLNAGISRTVRTHTVGGGQVTLVAQTPFPYAIGAGQTFSVRAGCNKVKDGDCAVKFNNVVRFRGEPYLPAPESVT